MYIRQANVVSLSSARLQGSTLATGKRKRGKRDSRASRAKTECVNAVHAEEHSEKPVRPKFAKLDFMSKTNPPKMLPTLRKGKVLMVDQQIVLWRRRRRKEREKAKEALAGHKLPYKAVRKKACVCDIDEKRCPLHA